MQLGLPADGVAPTFVNTFPDNPAGALGLTPLNTAIAVAQSSFVIGTTCAHATGARNKARLKTMRYRCIDFTLSHPRKRRGQLCSGSKTASDGIRLGVQTGNAHHGRRLMKTMFPLLMAVTALAGAFAIHEPAARPQQGPPPTPPEIVATYNSLADAILAVKKTEHDLVMTLLAGAFRHAEARMNGALAK